ncbi:MULTISPECIES: sulfite exporter TauE/SafE family protein [Microbacterium]|uniref:Probable membrane transporter protein n=1 Tax=Microbacterium wangchenii TaxID=2541726 RepID=A0ABX5SU94_9MICO|nr:MULTISPECIES: sulfite exporter TauE/SafE family protein [Microbacterium]MCK6067296.1 sulfite exporter TauE/SafE family protein [Microbacterium sp. EYE_512]QBR89763.1 sulfite exporter TauE/SafE family protein [Microbacterium wangchenii]TFV85378.1 sulfite exporter TauE/SafE family protein [Microbacterium sp. dk485]TXK16639.1 sulfite exporter TauE/SafE family protein [Microbacterium wangchenii]
MNASAPPRRGARFVFACVGIGLLAGLLSGLFGVGGGTVIVPLLVLLLGFDQRRAAGTSLAAIVPTAAVGVISYAVSGSVAWIPALILAAGAVIGAQVGTWLLPRMSQTALRWAFVAFLVGVIVSLFFVIPSREATLELTWLTGAGLAALGLITGVLAGLLGVGGGIIVVPALLLLFGTSDLEAKGTSLLMMIPTAISGTIGNLRRRNVDLAAAGLVGLAACTTTAVGAWLATIVDPFVGNILFAAFLVFIAVQMAIKAVRGRKR